MCIPSDMYLSGSNHYRVFYNFYFSLYREFFFSPWFFFISYTLRVYIETSVSSVEQGHTRCLVLTYTCNLPFLLSLYFQFYLVVHTKFLFTRMRKGLETVDWNLTSLDAYVYFFPNLHSVGNMKVITVVVMVYVSFVVYVSVPHHYILFLLVYPVSFFCPYFTFAIYTPSPM